MVSKQDNDGQSAQVEVPNATLIIWKPVAGNQVLQLCAILLPWKCLFQR